MRRMVRLLIAAFMVLEIASDNSSAEPIVPRINSCFEDGTRTSGYIRCQGREALQVFAEDLRNRSVRIHPFPSSLEVKGVQFIREENRIDHIPGNRYKISKVICWKAVLVENDDVSYYCELSDPQTPRKRKAIRAD